MSGNAFKYQTIKLKRIEYFPGGGNIVSGPYFYTIPDDTFPIKDFNNIHSFRFYIPSVPGDSYMTKSNLIEIDTFKISDYEIVGSRTPLKLFSVGTSIKFNDRFTEVNIPNNLQQIKCFLNATTGSSNDIYLILRLNNVKPEEHFKNYHRYETQVFDLINSPDERIKKFSFRPKVGAKRIKGVSVAFSDPNHVYMRIVQMFPTLYEFYPYTGIPMATPGSPVGKLSLNFNNKKSLPVLVNCKDYYIENVSRRIEFLELDEPILKSSDIDGYFINSPEISPSLPNFTMYLTHKYSIS